MAKVWRQLAQPPDTDISLGPKSVPLAANPRARQPAHPEDLIDVAHVVTAYYTIDPDPDNVDQQVAFGTSGHRGSSLDAAFNEPHILATTIVEYRAGQGTTGPLFIGRAGSAGRQ